MDKPDQDSFDAAELLSYASARLGAPVNGVLAGASVDELLEALLRSSPPGRIILAGSLQPHWGPILDALGRPWSMLVLEGREAMGTLMDAAAQAGPGDQMWLNLERTPALDFMDLLSLDAFLAFAAARPAPPLVVIQHDDAPGLVRTQRLAVDRLENVLLVRESIESAYALGMPAVLHGMAGLEPRPHPPVLPHFKNRRHLLVLDVDGVLLDPGRAFTEAVAGALAELEPGMPWDDLKYAALKRMGGFNNDFRLAAGALALFEAGLLADLAQVDAAGLAALAPRMDALEPMCTVIVRKHYSRTHWLERPLVRRHDLDAFKGDMAIFTGRPPVELAQAFEVLGFRLPAVTDSALHLRKPRPEGLIQLADAYRTRRITFVGDSVDDATALAAARRLRPDLDWVFAAVGPNRAGFAGAEDLQAECLLDLLPQLSARSLP